MRKSLIIFGLLVSYYNSYSQELDLNEQSNLIRPSTLKIISPIDSGRYINAVYLQIKGTIGVVNNYQYRSYFLEKFSFFEKTEANLYYKNFQLSYKFIPIYNINSKFFFKNKLQFSFLIPFQYGRSEIGSETERALIKFQLGWNFENIKFEPDSIIKNTIIHEFTAELSSHLFFKNISEPLGAGGYFAAYRPQQNSLFYGVGQRQFLYNSKYLDINSFIKSIYIGYGYYRENKNGIDKGAILKLELLFNFGLRISNINIIPYLAYSVDYRNSRNKNWEVGITYDINAISKAFIPYNFGTKYK